MASWIVGAMETYRGAVEQGQRRWLDAQQEACSCWLSSMQPGFPLSEREMARRIDGGLLAGASIWQAQADIQRGWMLAAEKVWTEMGRSIARQLPDDGAAPIAAVRQALEVGCVSGAAISTASRQAGHFAATSFSGIPLKTARDVRRVLRQR
ncbi:hypothetical protein [Chromobacterium violaceum]|uniref:Uncharacterized protein n=2 Tax=Chromobacterium violaceum TaxID=536 RepID=Q7NTJ4_CHRVO|nr:hypothetical protein [Chromobacterium violaceum]AAQ60729.1 hypothetical protein CV_3060 [Chromobacterium violaceum ATCC 12472]MBP4046557.1 hypothetical protein [Chromobacterium violaceum]OQS26931.1 hypothetical protein B0T41_10710 [Chromobacterium violaceum]SUX39198.1 Uncharacterised protein [Chromobacterium violaceum]